MKRIAFYQIGQEALWVSDECLGLFDLGSLRVGPEGLLSSEALMSAAGAPPPKPRRPWVFAMMWIELILKAGCVTGLCTGHVVG